MKNWIPFTLCIAGFTVALSSRGADDYPALRERAESFIVAGSYAKANEAYRSVTTTSLTPSEQRWVAFRTADTQWRSAAATQRADHTELESARSALEQMVRDVERDEERDRVWVGVQESLGDFWWTRRDARNWGQAWPYYERALDWWAGQSELDLARQRYLDIVWRCSQPPQIEPYYHYGWHGNYLPLAVLQNAVRIARTDDDQARGHYLIASTLQQQGGSWEQQARVPRNTKPRWPWAEGPTGTTTRCSITRNGWSSKGVSCRWKAAATGTNRIM